jgi:hypothetical protein
MCTGCQKLGKHPKQESLTAADLTRSDAVLKSVQQTFPSFSEDQLNNLLAEFDMKSNNDEIKEPVVAAFKRIW